MTDTRSVQEAAAELVRAFANNDRQAYFNAFSADATFVFYTLPEPLLNREAYQRLWDSWRANEGFEVLSCASSNACVSMQGDVAIFMHDVATELRMNGETFSSQERETIVFRHQGGQWLACHEHLSASPQSLPSS